ncbi:MAG TPA: amino acid adenylation domain-containing protein, partial [Thermoanaerobaculia bacterium]|nr:amino acid adenylation domain-containing protein [Thermoanaerobaculia bacterium]
GGAGLARGYHGRADLTAERFVPDPFGSEPGGRLYRTGDRCRQLPDGRLEFLGRLDQQVKLRGFRIELGEIEATLVESPGVQRAAVVMRDDLPGGSGLVAYVVAEQGTEPAVSELRQWVSARLPAYMVPSVFAVLESLPLTASGKTDRQALLRTAVPGEGVPQGGALAPRTPVEELVASIWGEVLLRERIGIEDNFFDLGGHSLLATRVVSRLRQVFEIELPLRALFQEPTVAGLAAEVEAALRSGRAAAAPVIERVSRTGDLPLSFAQQRLWFLDQLAPGSPIYNIPAALPLSADLNPGAFACALHEVIRRHEALRTTFITRDGMPIQVVAPEVVCQLPEVDLSALPADTAADEARRLGREEAGRPFDLAAGPLLRTTLLRPADRHRVLLLTVHHIVSDGWSMQVLEREMTALYAAFSRGEASPLPELPIQYADFAVWQRAWLEGGELQRQLEYWRGQLAGAPAGLDLPTDHPRPAVATFRGALRSVVLPRDLGAGLQSLGRREGTTLFMVLVGVFSTLLSRITGQEDVLVGSPIANRTRVEIEGLIGFFVNTLVLRTDLAGEPTFRELLERVRRTALEAYAHQDLPFERLVDELAVERSLSRSPLFQVMLVLQNAAEPQLGSAAPVPAPAAPARNEGRMAKFDLTLAAQEDEAGLYLGLEYNTDLFDGVTIERLLGHFENLLTGVVESPGESVFDLPILREAERHELRAEWNDTAHTREGELCLHQLFEQQARKTPAAPALVAGKRRWSYDELNRLANRLAHRLRRLGVGPESRVGVLLERSPQMVAALLGVLKAGGAYVPLDPSYPADRLAFMVRHAGVEILLATEGLSRTVPVPYLKVLLLDAQRRSIAREPAEDPVPLSNPGNLAYVVFTSGSTGMPKGVAVEHRSPVELVRWSRQLFSGEELSGVLASTSISFDVSVFELFVPLSRGGTVILARDVLELSLLAAAGEVTLVSTVPSAMAELASVSLPAQLRVVSLAGEALPSDLVRRLRMHGQVSRILNLYGPSEDTVYSTFGSWREGEEQIPIGRPVDNSWTRVLDPYMGLQPVGVPGELYLGGAGLARGYHGRADLTAERFVPDPFGSEPGGRLYRTGDRCRQLPDG